MEITQRFTARCCFHWFLSVFLYDSIIASAPLDIPWWIPIICPLVIFFFGTSYLADRRQWMKWQPFIASYELQIEQKIGLWGAGQIILTGNQKAHTVQLIFQEEDRESGDTEHCRIQLFIPCPDKEILIELDSLDVLKEKLEELYGL